jgi:hypothetical protein
MGGRRRSGSEGEGSDMSDGEDKSKIDEDENEASEDEPVNKPAYAKTHQ